jgi:hypothetical protein
MRTTGNMLVRIPTVGPFRVERHDLESGGISYEIWDYFAGTYHRLCVIDDFDNPHAKYDAELIVKALNDAIKPAPRPTDEPAAT